MDDGFYGCFAHGIPIARAFGYPVTVYVTTWYVENCQPLPNIVVQYIFWRCGKSQIVTDTGAFSEAEAGRYVAGLGAATCATFLEMLAQAGGVDPGEINDRRFSLMNPVEIRSIAQAGADIQLHTHRHRWPEGPDALCREISDNKRVLSPLVGKPLEHLCYPSGLFLESHWPLLREMGIKKTATTLPNDGIAGPRDNMLKLPRLLDGTNVTEIEFEAQMCGLLGIIYRARQAITFIFRRSIRSAIVGRAA